MDHTCHYSEVSDSMLYLQFSLISLRLVACNIQKKLDVPSRLKKKKKILNICGVIPVL